MKIGYQGTYFERTKTVTGEFMVKTSHGRKEAEKIAADKIK
jgi:hypothetical protein